MKQSSRQTKDTTAFLYVRLSRDDNLDGESYSIQNQKKLLTKAAKDMGYTNLVTFVDDGVSGVTMNRPGFNAMMAELEKGHAYTVVIWITYNKAKPLAYLLIFRIYLHFG